MRIVVLLCLGLLAGGTTPVRAQRRSSMSGKVTAVRVGSFR